MTLWRRVRDAWNHLVPDVDQLGDTLPTTLAEHKERQRVVEENRLIALAASERVHRHTTTSHLRRGA
jgi:hypothetical protein